VTAKPQTPRQKLASRIFDERDQLAFARLTGDFNPIHVDPIAARRTLAGDVVVHGVHGALWALDKLAELGVVKGEISSLAVKFPRFMYLGRPADLCLVSSSGDEIVAIISTGSTVTTTLTIGLGKDRESDDVRLETGEQPTRRTSPVNWSRIDDIAQLQGWIGSGGQGDSIGAHFPNIASRIGDQRVAAIASLSTLVGMECPGLNSLFSSFSMQLIDTPRAPNAVRYRVSYTDDRFRIVRMSYAGAGIRGDIQAFLRPPVIAQRAIEDIANSVAPDEFKGSTALIVGGSRGLGALTAKVIAAGGGHAILTYARGKLDALELVDEIRAHAGPEACSAISYDALKDPTPQLGSLPRAPTHLYYFATPQIGYQRDEPFLPALLETFMAVYVIGFYSCCRYLASISGSPITAFYPSTIFAENTPATMIEYASAKTAGEMLCAHLNRSNAGIKTIVHRLPRLLTDQTSTIPPVATRDPLEVMLPIIREVQGGTRLVQGAKCT